MDFEAIMISLCTRLGCTYTREADDFIFDVMLEDRKQSITASFFEENEEQFLRISTTVDARENLREKKLISVLELNYCLLNGSLALFGGDLVLTDVVPARDIDIDRIALLVQYIARMGDNFEKLSCGADLR
jgi:hypothetical protein